MPFKCPNCDAEHSKVPGYVAQEVLTDRLKAKSEENARLSARVAELEPAATAAEELRRERDEARKEAAAVKEAGANAEAFRAIGVESAELQAAFKVVYDSAMAGVDEAERVPMSEWVKGDEARGHVLLRNHYTASAPTTPAEAPAQRAAPTRRAVDTEAGASDGPPSNARPPTPAELMAVMNDARYKALPFNQRRALRDSWQAGLADGTLKGIPSIPDPAPKA